MLQIEKSVVVAQQFFHNEQATRRPPTISLCHLCHRGKETLTSGNAFVQNSKSVLGIVGWKLVCLINLTNDKQFTPFKDLGHSIQPCEVDLNQNVLF